MTHEQLPDGLQLAEFLIGVAQDHAIFPEQREQCRVAIDAIRTEHAQRLTLQHHAADQAQRVADLERELETERMRLAACGVIAMADTPASAARARQMLPIYESASASDVARRVDECMSLRQRVADLEAEHDNTFAHIASIARQLGDESLQVDDIAVRVLAVVAERDTARGAVRELEAKVSSQDHALCVLRACVDRHLRDAADPPGYLQDAVIRAAGLGALHTERDAAIKERNDLRARLAWVMQNESASEDRDVVSHMMVVAGRAEEAEARKSIHSRKSVRRAICTAIANDKNLRSKLSLARPVPAIPAGWRLVKSGALAMVVNALRRDAEDGRPVRGEMADELLAAAPEAAR